MSETQKVTLAYIHTKKEFFEPFVEIVKRLYPKAELEFAEPSEGQIPFVTIVYLNFQMKNPTFDQALELIEEIYKNVQKENPNLQAEYDAGFIEISPPESSLGHPLEVQATELFQAAEFEKAIETIAPLLTSNVDKEKLNAYALIANCYFTLGNYKKAISYYKFLMDKGEILGSECLSLAECEIKERMYDEAKQTMDQAISLAESEGKKLRYIFSHATLLQNAKQFDRATVELNFVTDFFKRIKTTDATQMVLMLESWGPHLYEVLNGNLPTIQSWGKPKALKWLDDIATNTDDDGKQIVLEIKRKIQ